MEGTRTRLDYFRTWCIVLTKKLTGCLGKKIARKSRNSCCMNGGGVGAHRQLTRGLRWAHFWKQIQTLKECLCCHIYCVHLGTPWYQIVGDSRTVFNRESRYPRPPWLFSWILGTLISYLDPTRLTFCRGAPSYLSRTTGSRVSGLGQIAR